MGWSSGLGLWKQVQSPDKMLPGRSQGGAASGAWEGSRWSGGSGGEGPAQAPPERE